MMGHLVGVGVVAMTMILTRVVSEGVSRVARVEVRPLSGRGRRQRLVMLTTDNGAGAGGRHQVVSDLSCLLNTFSFLVSPSHNPDDDSHQEEHHHN